MTRCVTCDGSGSVDSGAPEPMGGGFYTVGCPDCNGSGIEREGSIMVAESKPVIVVVNGERQYRYLAIVKDGAYPFTEAYRSAQKFDTAAAAQDAAAKQLAVMTTH